MEVGPDGCTLLLLPPLLPLANATQAVQGLYWPTAGMQELLGLAMRPEPLEARIAEPAHLCIRAQQPCSS